MIRPTKYTDLNLSILNLGSFMIRKVKESKSLTYDELLNKTVDTFGNRARFNFVSTILFLYSLGLLDYSPRTDAFYYDKREVKLNEV